MTAAPVTQFDLIDHHGRRVVDADFKGSYLLVYFGFTHCKVVCPRSLGKLSRALEALGEKADSVTALYITVDPARDTPDVMRAYLEENHPRFLGLTGSPDNVESAKRAFRVFSETKSDPDAPDGYIVPHSAMAYLMGPDGRYLGHFIDSLDDPEIAIRMAAMIPE